jgi:hypothetical protein
MHDGIYARDKSALVHRITSFCVWSAWAVITFIDRGFGVAVQTCLFYLLPLFCIWFPESMSRYTGIMLGNGRHIDQPSHPTFLRYAGWFVLILVPIARLLIAARYQ